jgi:hypothetical protein
MALGFCARLKTAAFTACSNSPSGFAKERAMNLKSRTFQASAVCMMMAAAAPAQAAIVDVTLRVQNLAPVNSVSFAPLRFGFNAGTFDAFDEGGTAANPIISVAEGGSGSAWFPAFSAVDPGAVLGSTMGALTPGSNFTTAKFRIDTAINPFFTFASMVIPSNDFFIGNDDPMEYRLFDTAGNLLIQNIDQNASDIWNAGSETFDPLAAAFLVGGTNGLRAPENGVVGFNFSELAGFNGRTTAAGYTFNSGLTDNTAIYRISFAAVAVPEPAVWAQLIGGFALAGSAMRRRRAAKSVLA